MTDPWFSAAQRHDAQWVQLVEQLDAALEAAVAEVLAKLWRVVLGERVAVTAAVDQPPDLDGAEQAARDTWQAALERWVRPILFAHYARQYAANGGTAVPERAREAWWADTLARVLPSAERVVQALRAEIASRPADGIPELRDRVARVLGLDAPTKQLRDEIAEVEAKLAALTTLSDGKRAELLQRRVGLQAELFRLRASRARSGAYNALAEVDPDNADQFRRLARQASRGAGDLAKLERDLARVDEQLLRNRRPPSAEAALEEADLIDRRDRLVKAARESEDTWSNTATRIARTESTNVLNEATLQRGVDAEADAGERMVKVWLSAKDERTRPTHRVAHGQTVGVREKFRVGAAFMERPGDPTAPVEEVVNCRCSIAVLIESEHEEIAAVLAASSLVAHLPGQHNQMTHGRRDNGWRPTLPSQAAIDRFVEESWWKGPVYHGTTAEAAATIAESGFDKAKAGSGGTNVYGSGLYTTANRDAAAGYANARGGTVLTGYVDLRNPALDTNPEVLKAQQLQSTLGALVDTTRTLGQGDVYRGVKLALLSGLDRPVSNEDVAKYNLPPGSSVRDLLAGVDLDETLDRMVQSAADSGRGGSALTTEYLEWQGYDGVVVGDPGLPDELVVFEPRDFAASPSQEALTADGADVMTQTTLDDLPPLMWHGVIAREGTYTDDGRLFEPGAVRIQPLPFPARFQRSDIGGHDGAVVIGNTEGVRRFEGAIRAWGTFADGVSTPEVDEIQGLMATRMMRGNSVDGSNVLESNFEVHLDDQGNVFEHYKSIRLRATTFVAVPAFADAEVYLGPPPPEWLLEGEPLSDEQDAPESTEPLDLEDLDVLVADVSRMPEQFVEYWLGPEGSARVGGWGSEGSFTRCTRQLSRYVEPGQVSGVCANLYHRATGEWPGRRKDTAAAVALVAALEEVRFTAGQFVQRQLDGPTPITVDDDGAVYGHIAIWGTCHTGYTDRCVTPPHSASNYQLFHTGAVRLDDGTDLPVGKLTVAAGHADGRWGARRTIAHYDNSATAVAVVRAYEDEHGIQVTGVTIPGITPEQLAELRRSPMSGDWRPVGNDLELVAALGVNAPGFPVPRPVVTIVDGVQTSLVAAGALAPREVDEHGAYVQRVQELAVLAGVDPASKVAALAASLPPMTEQEMEARAATLTAQITMEV